MKVFISWSGERSRLLADALRQWLPGVINAAEPWISSSDIEPGARWGPELARQLEQTKYGILCITAENANAPWLLFEAGALSKYVDDARVVPLILDLKPTDIQGPLAQFQALRANKLEIKTLVDKINKAIVDAGEKGVDQSVLDQAFNLWWPELQDSIDGIPKTTADVKKQERTERELIEEILTLVRKIDNQTFHMQNADFSTSGIGFSPGLSIHLDEDGHLNFAQTEDAGWKLTSPDVSIGSTDYEGLINTLDLLRDLKEQDLPENSASPQEKKRKPKPPK